MKEKLHKYSFLGCLLLTGIVFFNWTDQWQLYTEPLQETYTKGVQLVDRLANGQWQELLDRQSDGRESVSGNVPGETAGTEPVAADQSAQTDTEETTASTQSPVTGKTDLTETTESEAEEPAASTAAAVPGEEAPKKVVYHTVDDSYFDDAVFIGDSRTVGMYEYGGLEKTSTFYASTGLTIYKMFDSAIVSVPGQK